MGNKRKLLIKISIAFFVLLIICTFLSKTIKNVMIPKVEITSGENGCLKRNFNTIGIVDYGQNEEVKSQGEWKILQVCVRPSENVDKGTILAKVDLTNIIREEKKSDINIMNAEYELKAAKASGDNDAAAIKEKEIELLKEQKSSLRDGLNENGEIIAPITGRVTKVYCSNEENIQLGQSLFVVSDNRNTYDISFKSSVCDAQYLHNGMDVTIYYSTTQQCKEIKSHIVSKQFNNKDDDYDYMVEVQKSSLKGQNLDLGEQVSVMYEGKGDLGSCIIPKESVVQDGNDGSFIYILKTKDGLFGKEYYVEKKSVNIIGSDNMSYSISDIGKDKEKIVLKSSKSLQNNTVVKLR